MKDVLVIRVIHSSIKFSESLWGQKTGGRSPCVNGLRGQEALGGNCVKLWRWKLCCNGDTGNARAMIHHSRSSDRDKNQPERCVFQTEKLGMTEPTEFLKTKVPYTCHRAQRVGMCFAKFQFYFGLLFPDFVSIHLPWNQIFTVSHYILEVCDLLFTLQGGKVKTCPRVWNETLDLKLCWDSEWFCGILILTISWWRPGIEMWSFEWETPT